MGEAARKVAAMRNGAGETCGSCRFFKRLQNQRGGFCRGVPPKPILIGMTKHPTSGEAMPLVNTYWPQVPDTEYCGRWDHGIDLSGIDLSSLGLDAPEVEDAEA